MFNGLKQGNGLLGTLEYCSSYMYPMIHVCIFLRIYKRQYKDSVVDILSYLSLFFFLSFGCSASFHLNSSEKLQLFILYESDRFSRHVLFQSVKRIRRIFSNRIGMGTVFIYEIIGYLYNISLNEFREFLCLKYIFWMEHICDRTFEI